MTDDYINEIVEKAISLLLQEVQKLNKEIDNGKKEHCNTTY